MKLANIVLSKTNVPGMVFMMSAFPAVAYLQR